LSGARRRSFSTKCWATDWKARQRDEEEGQTFMKKIGQEVLPNFLSVIDDHNYARDCGVKLAGSYDFDNEGRTSQRVEVIKDGVLRIF